VELTLTAPRNDRSRAYPPDSGQSIGPRGRRRSGRDEQRTVVKRNSYAPFGETFAPTVIDGTGYTGHVMDQATGLTYMQQRYYDPQIGRFLSTDPIPSDPTSGANFNSYWYANNNPYRFTDPDGRQAQGRGSNMGPQNFGIGHDFSGSADYYSAGSPRSRSNPAAESEAVSSGKVSETLANMEIAGKSADLTGAVMLGMEKGATAVARDAPSLPSSAALVDVAGAAKTAGRTIGVASVAASAYEAKYGATSADRGHGWVGVAVGVVSFWAPGVGIGYALVDAGVQSMTYVNPATGERSEGWTAVAASMPQFEPQPYPGSH